jgi:ribonuclease Z
LVFHAIDPEKNSIIMDGQFARVSTIPMNHNFPTCGFLIREKEAKPNIRKDFLAGKKLENEDYKRIKDGADYIDQDGKVYANADITRPPRPARSYAYCTDTAYDESIVPLIRDVDMLYHEATFMDDRKEDAAAKYHATAGQAATIARLAGVKKLVLGHFSARYKDLDALLAEAKEVFPDSVLAEEGITLPL